MADIYFTDSVSIKVVRFEKTCIHLVFSIKSFDEDNIVVYNFMTKETAPLVSNKTIKDFRSFLKRKYAIDLKLSPEVEKYILEKITSYDVLNLGARGIVMTTENMLKNPIADYLSNAELSVDSTVTLYMEDERIVCR